MKLFTVFTVRQADKNVDYEAPGVGQEAVKKFKSIFPKGTSFILRGFFVGEEKKFIPVDLNSN